jgi:hypothetical protein
MDLSNTPGPESTKPRGRPFTKGNGGRKPGSRNRSSVIAEALTDVDPIKLAEKAYTLALDGNVPMLKFLLERIMPRERLIHLDLPPMNYADDAVAALASITNGVVSGKITPSEGASLATLINSYARVIHLEDVVKRLRSLEIQFSGRAASFEAQVTGVAIK